MTNRRLVFVPVAPPAEDEPPEPVPFVQRLAADFAAHHPREEAA